MADLDDRHAMFGVRDGAEDAIVAMTQAVQLEPAEFLAAGWSGLIGQSPHSRHDTPAVVPRQRFELPGC